MGLHLLELFVKLLESFHCLNEQILVVHRPFEVSGSLGELALDMMGLCQHLVVGESSCLQIDFVFLNIGNIRLSGFLVYRELLGVWTSPGILGDLGPWLICEEICQFHPAQLSLLLKALLLFELLGRFLGLFLLSLLLEPLLFLLFALFFLLHSFTLFSSFSFQSFFLLLGLFIEPLLLFRSLPLLALTLLSFLLLPTLLVLLLLLSEYRELFLLPEPYPFLLLVDAFNLLHAFFVISSSPLFIFLLLFQLFLQLLFPELRCGLIPLLDSLDVCRVTSGDFGEIRARLGLRDCLDELGE